MPAVSSEKMWAELLQDEQSVESVLTEIRQRILEGEIETAKGMLRTLINATCGFVAVSDDVGRNSKSIMRMLSPDVDPGVKAFIAVVNATERQAQKTH
ncbi:MAG: hypothetical protein ACTH5S_02900 [Hafnia alvei]|uniref:hypothetical protein n=1 Tax=Hafnia alvei TaxID=569 RepID=UPI0010342547|nr:hypothetical protein [Hafnia alvei]KAA0263842.1 hypothetical protein ERL64_04710 [Hafnia alvei]MCE9872680.1 hypothetical protein [Hafnia alvei]TBL41327.1 hypothetical protein EYZ01_04120 [Hafnia alvei]